MLFIFSNNSVNMNKLQTLATFEGRYKDGGGGGGGAGGWEWNNIDQLIIGRHMMKLFDTAC